MSYVLKVVVDGKETLVPIEAAAKLSVAPGAQISVVDAATGEVVENVTVARAGEALVVSVDGEQIAVLDGFYAEGAGATFTAGDEQQFTSADTEVWTRTAHAEGGLGGNGLALAGIGLGGLAVAAAGGGGDEAEPPAAAPVDSGHDVTVTFELDQDANSATFGSWISTIEGQEGNAISADLSYNFIIKVPLLENVMDGAQEEGDILGDGLLSQAWNLGEDDTVTFLVPEIYNRENGATYTYMSHSARNSESRYYKYHGLRIDGDNDLRWASLYYNDRSTGSGYTSDYGYIYVSYSYSAYRPTIDVFTRAVSPLGDGISPVHGVMDDKLAYYYAGTALA